MIHKLILKQSIEFKNKLINTNVFQSFLLAFNQGVIVLIFLGIDFIYSKNLSIDEFGEWKKLLFILNFMIPLISFGIPEGYKYYLAKQENKNILFSNTLILYLIITFLAFIIIFSIQIFSYFSNHSLNNQFSTAYYLLPICFFSFIFNKTLRYLSINEKKILEFTKETLLSLTIPLVILICIYFNWINTVTNYLIIGLTIFIITYLTPSFISFFKKKHLIHYKWLKKDFIRKIIKIGFPLYLSAFIGSLTTNIGLLIVEVFENTKTFAIFSVGAFEIPIFAMLSAAFSQKIYPDLVKLISNEKHDDAKKLWINTTIKVSYITYPLIAILMFYSKEIIFLIYKQDYSQAIPIFKTFLMIGLFRNNYYGALITASGKSTIIFKYSIFTLLMNSILSLSLYYFFGINGIVYGNLVATIAINFLQLRSEKLIHLYLNEFILNPKIIILISLIICIYVIY